jgi:hypothetical protein
MYNIYSFVEQMKTLPFLSPATIYFVYDDITFPHPFSLIRFASITGLVHCHAEPLVTKETYAPYILSLPLRRRPAVAGSSRGKQTAHDNEVQGNRSPKMDCVLNERKEYPYVPPNPKNPNGENHSMIS